MPLLEVDDVSMTFSSPGGKIEVLDRISFSVVEGEFVSLLGPSGCGKTTLLRIVAGFIRPLAGLVKIGSTVVIAPGKDRGFVFQHDSLYPWLTVIDNVTFGLRLRGMKKKERYAIGERFIDLVGLRGFEKYHPYQISGGMRQRANLARALVMDPKILLMDEPFAALDAQTREVMQLELIRICRDAAKTVLFVTHQIDEAIYLSNRVIVMSSRPARIRSDLNVTIPRPRPLEVKQRPEFVEYVKQVWKLIEGDVKRQAMMPEESTAGTASKWRLEN